MLKTTNPATGGGASAPRSRRRVLAIERWRFSEFVLLGGIFSLGALILAIHLATWGVDVRNESRLLTETECVVEGRILRSRLDENGVRRYRPEVKIRYRVGNETFVASTFDRSTLSEDKGFTFDRDAALVELAPYYPGMKTTCWTRVDDPKQAILIKKSTIWGWVFLVVPVSLILFGGGWTIVRLRERSASRAFRADARRRATLYPTIPNVPPSDGSRGVRLARRLKSDVETSFYFGAAILGTIAWNLAAWSAFLYVATTAEGRVDFVLALGFGALFCGVGAVFAFRLWDAIRIERVVGSTALEISDLPILPGRKTKLALLLKGRIEAKRLDVFLTCEEVARYVQGTNSICGRREVFSRTLLTIYDVDVPKGGEESRDFETTLPLGVAPSFVAEHNEIVWKLVVQMEFGDGGTFRRGFGVVVYPNVVR